MKHIAVPILFSIIYIGCAGQTGISGPKGDTGPPGIKEMPVHVVQRVRAYLRTC